MHDAGGKRWSLDSLVSMLAPVVGAERARASVLSALASLRLPESAIDEGDARRVFQFLLGAGGLTGVAAHRVLSTMSSGDSPAASSSASVMRAVVNSDFTPPRAVSAVNAMQSTTSGPSVTRAQIVELLEHAVGRAVAETAVNRASSAAGFGPSGSVQSAMKVLETIAQEPGLVGITARFAKARLALRGA
jgi:hypothetical protein